MNLDSMICQLVTIFGMTFEQAGNCTPLQYRMLVEYTAQQQKRRSD